MRKQMAPSKADLMLSHHQLMEASSWDEFQATLARLSKLQKRQTTMINSLIKLDGNMDGQIVLAQKSSYGGRNGGNGGRAPGGLLGLFGEFFSNPKESLQTTLTNLVKGLNCVSKEVKSHSGTALAVSVIAATFVAQRRLLGHYEAKTIIPLSLEGPKPAVEVEAEAKSEGETGQTNGTEEDNALNRITSFLSQLTKRATKFGNTVSNGVTKLNNSMSSMPTFMPMATLAHSRPLQYCLTPAPDNGDLSKQTLTLRSKTLFSVSNVDLMAALSTLSLALFHSRFNASRSLWRTGGLAGVILLTTLGVHEAKELRDSDGKGAWTKVEKKD